jgi:hypothetical protein
MKSMFSIDFIKNQPLGHRIVIGVLIVTVLASLSTAYYFYTKASPAQADESAEEVIAAVGKLMVLPEGEMPTVATVSNPEKVKEQPFFANAKEGHKVLIYVQARKAILYDPLKNRIVEVASLTPNPTTPVATTTPAS